MSEQEEEEKIEQIPQEEVSIPEENYQDKYLRVLADLENTRRRLQKEKVEMARFAQEELAKDFLGPMDSFEAALGFAENMSPEVKNWAFGFQMILSQMKEILSSHGIHGFESAGQMFDPHLHEAVEMLETNEHKSGMIVKQLTKGYKSKEHVIRPARVIVAKEKINKEEE